MSEQQKNSTSATNPDPLSGQPLSFSSVRAYANAPVRLQLYSPQVKAENQAPSPSSGTTTSGGTGTSGGSGGANNTNSTGATPSITPMGRKPTPLLGSWADQVAWDRRSEPTSSPGLAPGSATVSQSSAHNIWASPPAPQSPATASTTNLASGSASTLPPPNLMGSTGTTATDSDPATDGPPSPAGLLKRQHTAVHGSKTPPAPSDSASASAKPTAHNGAAVAPADGPPPNAIDQSAGGPPDATGAAAAQPPPLPPPPPHPTEEEQPPLPNITFFTPPPPPTLSTLTRVTDEGTDSSALLLQLAIRWRAKVDMWIIGNPKDRPVAPCPERASYDNTPQWVEKMAGWYAANFSNRPVTAGRKHAVRHQPGAHAGGGGGRGRGGRGSGSRGGRGGGGGGSGEVWQPSQHHHHQPHHQHHHHHHQDPALGGHLHGQNRPQPQHQQQVWQPPSRGHHHHGHRHHQHQQQQQHLAQPQFVVPPQGVPTLQQQPPMAQHPQQQQFQQPQHHHQQQQQQQQQASSQRGRWGAPRAWQ